VPHGKGNTGALDLRLGAKVSPSAMASPASLAYVTKARAPRQALVFGGRRRRQGCAGFARALLGLGPRAVAHPAGDLNQTPAACACWSA